MKFQIISVKAEYESYRSRKSEPYKSSNKLYIWPSKESVIDNLWNRHNRPSKIWKEEVIPAILEALKEKDSSIYEIVKKEKWGWRQKCGCSCPCSPGFVGANGGQYYITAEVKFAEE